MRLILVVEHRHVESHSCQRPVFTLHILSVIVHLRLLLYLGGDLVQLLGLSRGHPKWKSGDEKEYSAADRSNNSLAEVEHAGISLDLA